MALGAGVLALDGCERRGQYAMASGQLAVWETYAPFRVLDGNPATEWLLLDASQGWIDVHLTPARHVRALRLVNAGNPPWRDRGAKWITITMFDGDHPLRSGRRQLLPRIQRRTLDVEVDVEGVDRVRVHIDSWYGEGGGLAEITVLEPPSATRQAPAR